MESARTSVTKASAIVNRLWALASGFQWVASTLPNMLAQLYLAELLGRPEEFPNVEPFGRVRLADCEPCEEVVGWSESPSVAAAYKPIVDS